jgi:hypothetical protein
MRWIALGLFVVWLSGCVNTSLTGRIRQTPGQAPQYEAEVSIQSEGVQLNDMFTGSHERKELVGK